MALSASMNNVQFPFVITLLDAPKNSASLTCHALIRHLPCKRMVCQATWEGRPVVVKLLFQKKHSRRHWLRQERGIWALLSRAIPVPVPLYSGQYQSSTPQLRNGYCVASNFIEGGKTLEQAWNVAGAQKDREGLLRSALLSLADLHQKGVFQRDLHFQNFLLQGSTTYILDQDSIVISSHPLSKKVSLANVCLFFAQLPPQYDARAAELFEQYALARGWKGNEATPDFLTETIRRSRAVRLNRFLRKIFRESTACGCIREWNLYAVYRREVKSFNGGSLFRELDSILAGGDKGNLKTGTTATVTQSSVGEQLLVIKRYNIKSFFHGFSRAFRKTRAAISWANAHRLIGLDIRTALPLALVEKRIGPIRRESFYISSHVPGRNCKQFFGDTSIPLSEKGRIADKIVELFSSLDHHKISHGDMKATNFLVNGDDVTVVDLDSMREHGSERSFRRAFKKDIARFLRNWEDDPEILALFKKKLAGLVDGSMLTPL